ncbi:hypothetical protein CKAH01_04439 [Colletotrichum kahawae]|uniref:Uncharacterized protein n=1 Tax=Colletotrichum kahawae TaxID=34407 RepID=A0AAD9YMC8_COLKA|nr:hypothetical protein CKAH01_04439 [Colletotrichum kahawae]
MRRSLRILYVERRSVPREALDREELYPI